MWDSDAKSPGTPTCWAGIAAASCQAHAMCNRTQVNAAPILTCCANLRVNGTTPSGFTATRMSRTGSPQWSRLRRAPRCCYETNRRHFEHFGARRLFPTPYCVDNDYFGLAAARLAAGRDAIRSAWGLGGAPV